MVRVKATVTYDGSKFHGFQVQNNLRTVQGEIQKALKNICKEKSGKGDRMQTWCRPIPFILARALLPFVSTGEGRQGVDADRAWEYKSG